jgi:hypothetical protein
VSVRITTASAKVAYVVAGLVAGILFAIAVAVTSGLPAASVVWGGFLLIWVIVAARTFRGENEPVAAPRLWWQITAQPTAGYIFAAIFLAQAAYLTFTSFQTLDAWVFPLVAAVNAFVAAMFLNSSIRLSRIQSGHVTTR